jgi:hypothetical protein
MTRRASLTGISTDAPGGDAKKQYIQRVEMVRMPSGSIVSIPSFEELNPPPPGFYGALMFALPISLAIWCLLGFAVWLLFFSGL